MDYYKRERDQYANAYYNGYRVRDKSSSNRQSNRTNSNYERTWLSVPADGLYKDFGVHTRNHRTNKFPELDVYRGTSDRSRRPEHARPKTSPRTTFGYQNNGFGSFGNKITKVRIMINHWEIFSLFRPK